MQGIPYSLHNATIYLPLKKGFATAETDFSIVPVQVTPVTVWLTAK